MPGQLFIPFPPWCFLTTPTLQRLPSSLSQTLRVSPKASSVFFLFEKNHSLLCLLSSLHFSLRKNKSSSRSLFCYLSPVRSKTQSQPFTGATLSASASLSLFLSHPTTCVISYVSKLITVPCSAMVDHSRLSISGMPIYHFVVTSIFNGYAVIHVGCVPKINPKSPLDKVCVLSCDILTGLDAPFNVTRPLKGFTVVISILVTVALVISSFFTFFFSMGC